MNPPRRAGPAPRRGGAPAIRLIGVGNEFRADDGVGLSIVRALQRHALSGVATRETTGDGADLLEAWRGAQAVFLFDAVRSGAPPGTVHRWDAGQGPLPARAFRHSTHALGVADAIELARALGELPPRVVVYGVEAAKFGPGCGLSPVVARAEAEVVARVLEDLRPRGGTQP